jgi:hypothetical protein
MPIWNYVDLHLGHNGMEKTPTKIAGNHDMIGLPKDISQVALSLCHIGCQTPQTSLAANGWLLAHPSDDRHYHGTGQCSCGSPVEFGASQFTVQAFPWGCLPIT